MNAVRAQAERIPTPTYGMVIFGRLEQVIIDSVKRRDAEKLGTLVAPNFMLHVNTTSGPMVQKSDWIAQSLREPPFDSRIERLTVRDVDNNISIASFVWSISSPEAHSIAVVDVWNRSGTGPDNWALRVRYATPLMDNMHVPGEFR
jgi:hypothetical protein